MVHGGLLGERDLASHVDAMTTHNIAPIDLLIVNLYPFEQAVASGADYETCVENIDIGGPTMVRAAAKNHRDVAIVVSSGHYARVLKELEDYDGHTTLATRFDLAIQAYEHTAAYDGMIANYFGAMIESSESGSAAGEMLPPLDGLPF